MCLAECVICCSRSSVLSAECSWSAEWFRGVSRGVVSRSEFRGVSRGVVSRSDPRCSVLSVSLFWCVYSLFFSMVRCSVKLYERLRGVE